MPSCGRSLCAAQCGQAAEFLYLLWFLDLAPARSRPTVTGCTKIVCHRDTLAARLLLLPQLLCYSTDLLCTVLRCTPAAGCDCGCSVRSCSCCTTALATNCERTPEESTAAPHTCLYTRTLTHTRAHPHTPRAHPHTRAHPHIDTHTCTLCEKIQGLKLITHTFRWGSTS